MFSVLALAAVSLTFIGSIYIQLACVSSINDTFNITNDLIKGLTGGIIGGLAFISQIPFMLKTSLNPILQCFYRWPESQPPLQQEQVEMDPNDPGAASGIAGYLDNAFSVVGALASLVTAVSNGLIAQNGRKLEINFDGIGAIGAVANSFFSTLGNTLSNDIPESNNLVKKANPQEQLADGGSSKTILHVLQISPDVDYIAPIIESSNTEQNTYPTETLNNFTIHIQNNQEQIIPELVNTEEMEQDLLKQTFHV